MDVTKINLGNSFCESKMRNCVVKFNVKKFEISPEGYVNGA